MIVLWKELKVDKYLAFTSNLGPIKSGFWLAPGINQVSTSKNREKYNDIN
jgi:hypothetical protein